MPCHLRDLARDMKCGLPLLKDLAHMCFWFEQQVWSSVQLDEMIKDPESGYGAQNGLIGEIVTKPKGEKFSFAGKK